MTARELEILKEWFARYTESFFSDIPEEQQFISLKVVHTLEVCRNIVRIAKEEGLGEQAVFLAEAIGLLHDIGRFPQFAEYKTFRDSISVNHGMLGSEILGKTAIMDRIGARERELLIRCVQFHNTFLIPETGDPELTFFIKLIRDADKLDIWRVFLEEYEKGESSKAFEIGPGLPHTPDFSEEVIRTIEGRCPASLSSLKTMNDLKLMQLSWVFDLNFRLSFAAVIERRYIERIAAGLPDSDSIKRATGLVANFARERLSLPPVVL